MVDTDADPPAEQPVRRADIRSQLDDLDALVTTPAQKQELSEVKHLLERLPGGPFLDDQIHKYTGRDIGEAFVGSIIFALPLLVEDGVFVIAEHFLSVSVAGIPLVLLGNVLLVMTLTAGLLYVVDLREVAITNPLFGLVPRRLVGVLTVSLLTTAGLMTLWGRLWIGDPTPAAMLARIVVVWTAAALGASLGDILPGESKGSDLTLSTLVGDSDAATRADSNE